MVGTSKQYIAHSTSTIQPCTPNSWIERAKSRYIDPALLHLISTFHSGALPKHRLVSRRTSASLAAYSRQSEAALGVKPSSRCSLHRSSAELPSISQATHSKILKKLNLHSSQFNLLSRVRCLPAFRHSGVVILLVSSKLLPSSIF